MHERLGRVPRDVTVVAFPVAVPLADVDLRVAFPVQVVEHAFTAVLLFVVAKASDSQVEVPAHVSNDGDMLLRDGAGASEFVPWELTSGGGFLCFGGVVLLGAAIAGEEDGIVRDQARGFARSGRCKCLEGKCEEQNKSVEKFKHGRHVLQKNLRNNRQVRRKDLHELHGAGLPRIDYRCLFVYT